MIDAQKAPPADPNATPDPASPAAPIVPTATTTSQITAPDPDAPNGASDLPPGDPRENDAGYWKQRARVTFGMLRQARDESAQVVAELRGQVRELREQLQTKGSTDPKQPSPAIDVSSMFTQEQIDQYGADQLAAITGPILAKVRQEAQEAVTAATKPLKEEREEQRTTELKRKWNAFVDQLVRAVPDALEIDKTQPWLDWLDLVDEDTGYTRLQMLKAHEGRFDAPKVAKLFQRYKAETGLGPAPAPASGPAPAPQPPVAPSARGGSGGGDLPPPSPALRPLTPQESREGYKRAALGKMSKEEREVFDARVALTMSSR